MNAFASQADLKAKKIRFERLSKSCWAFTAEGDPNSGVIVGDDGVMVIDAQATPLKAREVIRRIRRVTSSPGRARSTGCALAPRALVPGRVPALTTSDACGGAIRYTRDFVRGLYACARQGVNKERTLMHPRIWTAKRDRELWQSIA